MISDPLALLDEAAHAVAVALSASTDRGPSGRRDGQYAFDVATDAAVTTVLARAGVAVLSEEHEFTPSASGLVVVVDPVDGSTNASRGIPWYATALCVVDPDGPAAALVVDLASGRRWWAVRGGGAFADGVPMAPSGCVDAADAIVGMNGVPPRPITARQTRMFGSAALDLCLVAGGQLDGYVDWADEAHGVWDYLAASLICAEAGATVVDAFGRDLVVLDRESRRTPVAAGTPALAEALVAQRRGYDPGSPGA